MKSENTELIFVLDRSGSMSGLEQDTIGGFNAMLEKQKLEPGEALVTTVLFNHTYQVLHNRMNISEVTAVTKDQYCVGGMTALLDAVGSAVSSVIEHHKKEASDASVMFVIITDGMENSSREYSLDQIRHMIAYQQETYGWEFLFLGANLDAVQTAESMGIRKNRAARYHDDRKGTILNYETISVSASRFRNRKPISDGWANDIKKDYRGRGRQR